VEFVEGISGPARPGWGRRRPWHQPESVLPSSAPGEALVIRTQDAAVWVGALRAYPDGFEFTLRAVRREGADDPVPSARPVPRAHTVHDPFRPAVPDTGIRLGIAYADGRQASAGEGVHPLFEGPEGQGLWLLERSGGGNEWLWDAQFWVAPLPPEGPVTVIASWLEVGVTEQRAELDGTAIRAAGGRAVRLWAENEFLDDGPSHHIGTLVIEADDRSEAEEPADGAGVGDGPAPADGSAPADHPADPTR
jgi:hypothetical protein